MKHFVTLFLYCLVASTLSAQPYNLSWTKKTDLTGLPTEVSMYTTTSTLNGRAFTAWYAIADMSTGNIELRTLLSPTLKTPSQFVSDYGSNAYVCTNGGFFDTTSGTSYSLVIDRTSVAVSNIASVTRSALTYYPTRGALGVDANQAGVCGWNYSLSGVPWIYPIPSPNVEGSTPQAVPSTTFPAGGQKWTAYSAVGGGPLLVQNSTSLINYSTNYELLQSDVYGSGVLNPRTAIGYTADGKMVLLVCDGRNPGVSEGASLDELAQIMIELGCTNALNLDGGGSSAMIAAGTCLNNPSDGAQRPIPSAVMFAKREATVVPPSFTQLWNFTQTSGILPSPTNWTWGFPANLNARSIATDGKYVYVPVRANGDGVRVVDANTGQYIQTLSMTGVSGGTWTISEAVTTKDSKVLVCNLTTAVSSSTPFKIYVYDSNNLSAAPTTLLTFTGSVASGTSTGSNRFGDGFSFEGTMTNGIIRVMSHTIKGKYFMWTVTNGTITNTEPTVVTLYDIDGTTQYINLGGYPRIYPAGTDSLWIHGSAVRPRLFYQNKYVGVVGAATKNAVGNTSVPFTYLGKRMLALVDYANGNGYYAEGVVINVTAGADGVEFCRTPTNFGAGVNGNGTDGAAVYVSASGIKVYFLSPSEGVAAYTIGTPDTPITGLSNVVASEVSMVYPNPAHNNVYFTQRVKKATIYSLSGQVVAKVTDTNQISVSGLSGLYLVEIIDQGGKIHNNSLIVK